MIFLEYTEERLNKPYRIFPFKLKDADNHKVKAIILYSDPDQYSPFGTSYPDSWYLPDDGVQRGTVLRIRGDPLSNGYPALGKCEDSRDHSNLQLFHVLFAITCPKDSPWHNFHYVGADSRSVTAGALLK